MCRCQKQELCTRWCSIESVMCRFSSFYLSSLIEFIACSTLVLSVESVIVFVSCCFVVLLFCCFVVLLFCCFVEFFNRLAFETRDSCRALVNSFPSDSYACLFSRLSLRLVVGSSYAKVVMDS